jgi:cytochrome c peroxidase
MRQTHRRAPGPPREARRVRRGPGGLWRSLAGALAAACSLLAAPVRADAPLPIGYGALGYAPPEAGSYSLPPLFGAADGPVLAEDGTATRLHEVFGDRVVVLSFVYSSCSDVAGCPLATAVLHRIQQQLGSSPALAGRVRLVSLSFDPAHDTPEVMRLYGQGLRARAPEWRFLTTSSTMALQPVLAAYGQPVSVDYDAQGQALGTFSHLLRVYLIDPAKRVRNIYSVSFLHPELLIADIRTVLLEEGDAAARPWTAGQEAGQKGSRLAGAGDDKAGYAQPDYKTRSRSLEARSGRPADLLRRAQTTRLGLPPVPVPAGNPLTAAKVALGRKLFYDRRLSLNGTMSCAMCHIPEQGFTSNELATAVGIEGRTVRRNTPTVLNAAYLSRLFHDGREYTLEQQIWGPLLARNEMGNPSVGNVIRKLEELVDYREPFAAAFGGRGPSMETIGEALASYQRTLVSGDSPFDRWHYGGDAAALSGAAQRGFALFTGRAGCAACHTIGPEHALFTDDALHNTGVGYREAMAETPPTRAVAVAPGVVLDVPSAVIDTVSEQAPGDLGLYEVTQDPDDRWKYRTPTLRNVALTAPYMHNGSLPTLEAVVAFYDAGGVPNEGLDSRIRPLGLSPAERADLVAFLESLTGADVDVLIADAFAAPVGDPVAPE